MKYVAPKKWACVFSMKHRKEFLITLIKIAFLKLSPNFYDTEILFTEYDTEIIFILKSYTSYIFESLKIYQHHFLHSYRILSSEYYEYRVFSFFMSLWR